MAERDLAKTHAEVAQLRAELAELQQHARATQQSADLRLAEQHGELTMRKVRVTWEDTESCVLIGADTDCAVMVVEGRPCACPGAGGPNADVSDEG